MSRVSICIPTYNRAEFLDFLLSKISAFDRLDYEVVISDNNSDDHTAAVVMRWRSDLKQVYYLKQKKTLSGPENAYAVCNAARGDYIFRISDDDLVVEEGLIAAQAILDQSPDNVAVYPRWHICDENLENISTVVHYGGDEPLIRNNTDRLEDASAHLPIRVAEPQIMEMFQRFWTVELPVFRRDVFQNHIGVMSNMMPLDFFAAAQFLKYGDLHFIWELCAKIRQHPGQDSRGLHSPRVLEGYASDYEQFLSCIPNLDPIEAMKAFYGKMIRQYVIASQFAAQSGDYLRALEIIRKALAFKVPGVEDFAKEFNKTHGAQVILAFLSQMIESTPNIKRLLLESSPNAEALFPHLCEKLTNIPVVLETTDQIRNIPIDAGDYFLLKNQAAVEERLKTQGANPARHRSLEAIIEACRA